jgi:hypothetical protein
MRVPAGKSYDVAAQTAFHYLKKTPCLFPAEITEVVVKTCRLSSSILEVGLESALAQSGIRRAGLKRPFIEVCDTIVEHFTHNVSEELRECVKKSLCEAYIYFAGPKYVFEPTGKTRFLRTLKHRGSRNFAALFLSLYLFNLICAEINSVLPLETEFAAMTSDGLHIFHLDAVSRDLVSAAVRDEEDKSSGELGEGWAAVVCRNIEVRLKKELTTTASAS